jgi:cysteine synthase
VLQEAVDKKYYDQIVPIAGPVGIEWSRKLAAREGIFTGISGGATFAATVQVAEKAPAGSVLLCMLPDTAERYLSSPLFEGIAEVMSPEETQLSQSTPGFQM